MARVSPDSVLPYTLTLFDAIELRGPSSAPNRVLGVADDAQLFRAPRLYCGELMPGFQLSECWEFGGAAKIAAP